MHKSPISIAIPYHKNLAYLQQAIDSVAKQTQPPDQLIIIDNSTNGEAEESLKYFQGNHRYIRSPSGQGLAAYFNQCLDSAQTPWCTILHSDDILLPEYIETMSIAIQSNIQAAAIFCKTVAIDEQGNLSFSFKDWGKKFFWPEKLAQNAAQMPLNGEPALAALLRANFIMCPTVCYNLPVLRDRRFNPAWQVMLDLDFYAQLLLDEDTLIGIPQTLYMCRRHPAATTSLYEKSFNMFHEGTHCIQTLAMKAAQKNWHYAARIGKRRIIYHLYVTFRVLRNLRPHNIKETLKFICSYIKQQH